MQNPIRHSLAYTQQNLKKKNGFIFVLFFLISYLQKEKLKCQMEYMESVKKLEEKLISSQRNHENGKRNGEVLALNSIFFSGDGSVRIFNL